MTVHCPVPIISNGGMGQISGFFWTRKIEKKAFSFRGLRPLTPHRGLCPLDPHYRLALRTRDYIQTLPGATLTTASCVTLTTGNVHIHGRDYAAYLVNSVYLYVYFYNFSANIRQNYKKCMADLEYRRRFDMSPMCLTMFGCIRSLFRPRTCAKPSMAMSTEKS